MICLTPSDSGLRDWTSVSLSVKDTEIGGDASAGKLTSPCEPVRSRGQTGRGWAWSLLEYVWYPPANVHCCMRDWMKNSSGICDSGVVTSGDAGSEVLAGFVK